MMLEYLPYFAGFITLLFSAGFAYALMVSDSDEDQYIIISVNYLDIG